MAGVVTERDEAWLGWVGRWRAVTAEQVARQFVPEVASGVKVVERRFRVWRELGLVASQRVLAGVPAVHTLRGPGMQLVGIEGPIRHPVVGQLRHDLAVVDLAVWLQRDPAVRLITEREIRAADAPGSVRPVFAVPAAPGSGRKLVFPDLLSVEAVQGVEGGGGRRVTAREVELSGKDVPRLVSLMRSYVDAPRVDAAVYYVPEALVARVSRAAAVANERAGREVVKVTGWAWQSVEGVGAGSDQVGPGHHGVEQVEDEGGRHG